MQRIFSRLLLYQWYNNNTLFHYRNRIVERKEIAIMCCSQRHIHIFTFVPRREIITHGYTTSRVKRNWKDRVLLAIIANRNWRYQMSLSVSGEAYVGFQIRTGLIYLLYIPLKQKTSCHMFFSNMRTSSRWLFLYLVKIYLHGKATPYYINLHRVERTTLVLTDSRQLTDGQSTFVTL